MGSGDVYYGILLSPEEVSKIESFFKENFAECSKWWEYVEDCGGDAHSHIGDGCKWARRCGIKRGEFHVSAQDWPKLSSASKVIRLNEYLETLTEARKQHALEDCARELGDLGIDPALVGKATKAQRKKKK